MREFIAQFNWVEWSLSGLFLLALLLTVWALLGERASRDQLPPRPLPLPAHRPEHAPPPTPQEQVEYAARHSAEQRERSTVNLTGYRMPGTFWVVKDRQQTRWPWRGSPGQ